MAAPIRPRRSVLYMPGSNPRALEKARDLPADGLIFDLEDAVAPDAKEGARATVAAALRGGGYGRREIVLRVNGADSAWGEADLAAASPRLGALVMGTSDLVTELHAQPTRERLPLVTALGLVVLAARAHGLAVLDGVHLDLADADGFAVACRQGREFGFDGKTLIHPNQIAAANAAFAPEAAEVERARRVVAAYAEAEAAGKGLVVLDGRLIEALHAAEAHRVLALAEAIAAIEHACSPG